MIATISFLIMFMIGISIRHRKNLREQIQSLPDDDLDGEGDVIEWQIQNSQ